MYDGVAPTVEGRVYPPCKGLGPECLELKVTLRVADLAEDTSTQQDALATWLSAHVERISFGEPYVRGRRVLVDAVLRVPCKHLRAGRQECQDGRERARCTAHGFTGPLPQVRSAPRPVFQDAAGRISLIQRRRRRWLSLQRRSAPRRVLRVLHDNPCVGAPCRTADNARGAACCRDLTLEVVAPADNDRLEPLLRSRRPPYVCKVSRVDADMVECEVISACGYLDHDGITCILHDRLLPSGRSAKPYLCVEWPDHSGDYATHPGCRLATSGKRET